MTTINMATSASDDEHLEEMQSQVQTDLESLTHSQYPSVAAKAIVDLCATPSHRHVEQSILEDGRPPSPPPIIYRKDTEPPPLPKSDPRQPCRRTRQRRMINALMDDGPLGLRKVLYDEAKDYRKDLEVQGLGVDDDIEVFLADQDNNEHHTITYLLSLPEDVTESLIKGTLPYDASQGPASIRDFCRLYMRPVHCPGIYGNWLAGQGPSAFGGYTDQSGRYLSTTDIESALGRFEVYLAETDLVFNAKIDKQFRKPGTKDCPWANTDASKDKCREFIAWQRYIHCKGTDAQKLDEPHWHCPTEIGWAQDVDVRVREHENNGNTTYCFDFMNALLRLSKDDGGFGFGETFSLLLFPLWKKDDRLAHVGEILGSLLTGSYLPYGGYNADLRCSLTDNDPRWDTAKRNLDDRLIKLQQPDTFKANNLAFRQKWLTYIKKAQSEDRLSRVVEEIKEVSTEYEEREGEVDKAASDVHEKRTLYHDTRDEKLKSEEVKSRLRGTESVVRIDDEIRRRLAEGSMPAYTLRPVTVAPQLSEEEASRVEAKLADARTRSNASFMANVKEFERLEAKRAEEDGSSANEEGDPMDG
ncbi:MAG: hypothetical protein Q9184_003767 [Pyrenodesmia sp. 2 TL-2023]